MIILQSLQMHGALMAKNYRADLNYCNAILCYEEENEFMKKFHRTLSTKLEIMEHEVTEYEDTSSASSTSLMESDSEAEI